MKIDTFSTAQMKQNHCEKFVTDFCMLPERVRKEEYRTGLISSELWQGFLMAPFPAMKEFWLVYEGDHAIGRIGASLSGASPGTGYFGFFEVDLDASPDSAANTLLNCACQWLNRQQQRIVFGPVDFSTWFPYRFRLPDRDRRCFAWEPVTPPEYVAMIKAAGFRVTERYHSTAFNNLSLYLEKTRACYHKALDTGVRFRRLEPELTESDIDSLYRISLASFRDNFLFEPISLALFSRLYLAITDKHKTNISYVAENAEGDGIALLFAFLDQWQQGELTESYVVLKSIAVIPEARGMGLSNALTYLAVDDALHYGTQYAVSAMVKAGIQSESYAKKGDLLWRHQYALFAKPLNN